MWCGFNELIGLVGKRLELEWWCSICVEWFELLFLEVVEGLILYT